MRTQSGRSHLNTASGNSRKRCPICINSRTVRLRWIHHGQPYTFRKYVQLAQALPRPIHRAMVWSSPDWKTCGSFHLYRQHAWRAREHITEHDDPAYASWHADLRPSLLQSRAHADHNRGHALRRKPRSWGRWQSCRQ
ncbi:MAG: hypothetical protein ACJAUZ_001473 [Flavobacteriaceae bacterium]|jgi:hypothetical protein